MALAHADRDGRLPGEAPELGFACYAALLCRYKWTLQDVQKIIDDLVKVGLWRLMKDMDGKLYLEIVNFDKHQQGMRYEREPVSSFRVMPTIAGNCRKLTAEVEVQGKLKRREGGGEMNHHPIDEQLEKRRGVIERSGGAIQEAHMITPSVISGFRKAHPSGNSAPVRNWDRRWIEDNAAALSQIKDMDLFWVRALESSRDGETMEQIGTRALLSPAILNGNGNGKHDEEAAKRFQEAKEWVAKYGSGS